MVHTAGYYKLPLVYGNAIKNGAANTVAYNPGELTTTLAYCKNFYNHADQVITDPWIKNNGITVTQAELLWQDAKGLITAVGIDGDYLTLTVGKDATSQEGNALIAAKDAGGTIVWSWHIWVTKQTFTDLTAVDTGVIGGTPSHTYLVTPVNLGWVGDATSATGYQTYYEWGRKDPFIPSTGTGNTDHTVYDINNNPLQKGYTSSTDFVGIGGNIKNPTTFYNVSLKPNSSVAYNMWDAQQTSTSDNIATPTVKTVYDPSPAGFCVPTGNLYKFIRNTSNDTHIIFTWDVDNMGRYPKSVTPNFFFPASVYRRRDISGKLDGVSSIGYYWSANAYSDNAGHEFYFISNERQWGSAYRANGFSVRAVAEE